MAEQSKIIKGQNLRIFIATKCIAYATSCQLQISTNLEDASTKDSTGSWDQQEVVGKSWSISVDALYSAGATDQTGLNAVELTDMLLAGNKVVVKFALTQGEKNREKVDGANAIEYTGNAWINNLSITAGNKANTSYTASLTGDGALSKTTPT